MGKWVSALHIKHRKSCPSCTNCLVSSTALSVLPTSIPAPRNNMTLVSILAAHYITSPEVRLTQPSVSCEQSEHTFTTFSVCILPICFVLWQLHTDTFTPKHVLKSINFNDLKKMNSHKLNVISRCTLLSGSQITTSNINYYHSTGAVSCKWVIIKS